MMHVLLMIVIVVLLQMFGEVVYGIPMLAFDTYFDDFKINTITRTMRIYLLKGYKQFVKDLKKFIEKKCINLSTRTIKTIRRSNRSGIQIMG